MNWYEERQRQLEENNKQNLINAYTHGMKQADYVSYPKQIDRTLNKVDNALNIGNNISNFGKNIANAGDKISGFGTNMYADSVLKNGGNTQIGAKVGQGLENIGTKTVQAGTDVSKIGSNIQSAISKAPLVDKAIGHISKGAPVIGTITGGLSAANDFANGDYVSGALNTASTAANAINGLSSLGSATASAATGAGASTGATAAATGATAGIGAAAGMVVAPLAVAALIYSLVAQKKKEAQIKEMARSQEALNKTSQAGNKVQQANAQVLEQQGQEIQQQLQQNQMENNMNETQTRQSLIDTIMNKRKGQITGGAAPIVSGGVQQTQASPEFVNMITGQQPQGDFISQLKQQAQDTINQPNAYEAGVQEVLNPQEVTPQTSLRDTLINKLSNGAEMLTSGAKNFMTGFEDNYTTNYNNGDLKNGVGNEDKGIAQRVGEFAGTAGRVIQNPAVAGLVSALVAKKANPNGGWRNAANVGLEMAKYVGGQQGNKALLQSMGYKVPQTGLFSGVTDAGLKSVVADQYNQGRVENSAVKNKIDQQKADQKYEIDLAELDLDKYGIDKRTQVGLANAQARMQLGLASQAERAEYHKIIAHLKQQGLDLSNARLTFDMQKDFQNRVANGEKIRVQDLATGKTGYVDANEFDPKLYKKI